MLKGAKRENNLEVEVKPGCVNLRFCNGSFFEIVLPLIKCWSKKVGEFMQINGTDIHILEVDAGLEKTDSHVDTKLVVIANGDRLVLHAYNGTQNLMVQGKNYEKFAINCLQPFFVQRIEQSKDQIKNFNNCVKEAFGTKSTARIKPEKPYNCQYCEVKPKTIGDLRLHMKKCHTKPALTSPNRNKAIKFDKVGNSPLIIEERKEEKNTINGIGKIMIDVEDLISCKKCDFDTSAKQELDEHMELIHGQNLQESEDNGQLRCIETPPSIKHEIEEGDVNMKESTSICGECGKGFDNEDECTLHISEHEEAVNIKCESCEHTSTDEIEMKTHTQSVHQTIQVDLSVEDQNTIKCSLCEYKCKLNIQYNQHMKSTHYHEGKYTCKHCDYSTNFIGKAWEHTLEVHEEMANPFTPKESGEFILNVVAEQTTSIIEELEVMKKDTKDVHNNLANVLETLILKIAKLETAFAKQNTKLNTDEKKKVPKIISSTPEKEPEPKEDNRIKKTYASALSSSPITPPKASETTSNSSSITNKTNYLQKQKILFVGDSVGLTANLRIIEKSHKCRIRSARAYSSVYDKSAKWPAKNFKDVVTHNLKNPGDENYKTLMMSSPTVDISNIASTIITGDSLEQKVIESSKNMFTIAEQALMEHKTLKKVIIMEHPPRFDGKNAQLVQVANNALKQLHGNSSYKDMIVVGQHSLECPGSGSTHTGKYRDSYTGRYDGVHMYGYTGTRDYKDSVSSILLMAFPEEISDHHQPRSELGNRRDDHSNCEQAQYQREQMNRLKDSGEQYRSELGNRREDHTRCAQTQYQWRQMNRQKYSAKQYRYGQSSNFNGQPSQFIPTNNRFDVFNQGNY